MLLQYSLIRRASPKHICHSNLTLIFRIYLILQFYIDFTYYSLCYHVAKINKDVENVGKIRSLFNDPNLKDQWYYITAKPAGNLISHELDKLWAKNITGQGVNIAIVQGSIQQNHRDLSKNYNRRLSNTFLKEPEENQVHPKDDTIKIAGLISALANNKKCGVGAAPSSRFSILQIFKDHRHIFDDFLTSKALIYKNHIIDIYVLNWKFNYDVYIQEHPGKQIVSSLQFGIKLGRKGLGSIYVTGSGDRIRISSNCAFNGLLQRPEILVFGSVTGSGRTSQYAENCTAIIASTISTSDEDRQDSIYTTTHDNKCENSTGSSLASASIGAGIIALLLSHNPKLTYRQIALSIIMSTMQLDSSSITNAAGLLYSYSYGFGMIVAEKLLEHSKHNLVTHLLPEHCCHTTKFSEVIRIYKQRSFLFRVYSSGCLNSVNCVTEIEQVIAIFTIKCFQRNKIRIIITSPSGTSFVIIEPREFDTSANGFVRYSVKIMGFYGESPHGVWILEVITSKFVTYLKYFEIVFYGTCISPKDNLIAHEKVRDYIWSKNSSMISIFFVNYFSKKRDYSYQSMPHDVFSFTQEDNIDMESIRLLRFSDD